MLLPTRVLRAYEKASQRLPAAPYNSFSWRLLTRLRELELGVEVAELTESSHADRMRVAANISSALEIWRARLQDACSANDNTLLGRGAAFLTLIGPHHVYGYHATCFPSLVSALREGHELAELSEGSLVYHRSTPKLLRKLMRALVLARPAENGLQLAHRRFAVWCPEASYEDTLLLSRAIGIVVRSPNARFCNPPSRVPCCPFWPSLLPDLYTLQVRLRPCRPR